MTTKQKPAELTITRATSQARRAADKVMPGAQIFIHSQGSWDLETDTHLMVTEVSYPINHPDAAGLVAALTALPGFIKIQAWDCRILLTRTK